MILNKKFINYKAEYIQINKYTHTQTHTHTHTHIYIYIYILN